MQILHFSAYDTGAGAASAAYQLHQSLNHEGHSSRMVVRNKSSSDPSVQSAPFGRLNALNRIIGRVWPQKLAKGVYTFNANGLTGLERRGLVSLEAQAVDIICLHWINNLLTARDIKYIYDHYQRHIVWTLMDQEPVTGGCHYSFDCDGFEKQCGNCPQLVTSHSKDRSHVTWRSKFENLSGLPIVFVAPTNWLAQRIQKSSLFRNHQVEIIPLAIDTTVFRPFDQSASRNLLHLPQNKKIVFFGARYLFEERKGMRYLFRALEHLANMLAEAGRDRLELSDVHLLVVGNGLGELSLPFSHTAIPHLNDNISLALAYQASDVFVCPSVEDAGPMMIPESMLCGTPVVAFNTGGAPDLITTMKNGYLASYKNSEDLAKGVYSVLTRDSASNMRADARTVALKHSPAQVVQSYSRLFQSLRAS